MASDIYGSKVGHWLLVICHGYRFNGMRIGIVHQFVLPNGMVLTDHQASRLTDTTTKPFHHLTNADRYTNCLRTGLGMKAGLASFNKL
jgi:hypothetical protein